MKQMYTGAILTIGDEILNGQITDTNSTFIASQLNGCGYSIEQKISVGDNKKSILHGLNTLCGGYDFVIITGGLGPTKDDITKFTLAEYFNCELELFPDALKQVESFFKNRGKETTELNKKQAWLPSNCTYIRNQYGTAPAMWFEKENQVFISLPGVPVEMKKILVEEIQPRLIQKFKPGSITHRIIKTIGIGESYLADKIESWETNLPSTIKLAYLPEAGQVKLRLTAIGESKEKNEELIAGQLKELQRLAGKYIYAYNNVSLEETVGNILMDSGLSIATAESCTGGAVAAAITSVPGSSGYFHGSIIAYQNKIKSEVLKVNIDTLQNHGAVSEKTVIEMAEGVKRVLDTDIGLSCSGIAGPGGGTAEKPVGTVWIAVSDQQGTISKKLSLTGDRKINISLTVLAVLNLLRQRLTQNS